MEQQEKKSVWLMGLTGFLIGVAAIAPGISGGAITIIFGLYEPIADAVAHIWQNFRQKVRFLLPLAVGAGMGIMLSGWLINYLFSNFHDATCALFLGLIVGTLPSVFKTAARDGFRLHYLLATVVCGGLVLWATTLEQLQYTGAAEAVPYWLTLTSGGIVGLGTVLPGVSASFILMAIGVYEPMLRALNDWNIVRLLLLGVGFGSVVLMMTRLMSYLFKKAHGWMSFATAGMLVGSLYKVIPVPGSVGECVLLAALAAGGAVLSYVLLKLKK